MSSDSQVYREEFDTEAEAIAFTEGIDFMDSDHVSYEAPKMSKLEQHHVIKPEDRWEGK